MLIGWVNEGWFGARLAGSTENTQFSSCCDTLVDGGVIRGESIQRAQIDYSQSTVTGESVVLRYRNKLIKEERSLTLDTPLLKPSQIISEIARSQREALNAINQHHPTNNRRLQSYKGNLRVISTIIATYIGKIDNRSVIVDLSGTLWDTLATFQIRNLTPSRDSIIPNHTIIGSGTIKTSQLSPSI